MTDLKLLALDADDLAIISAHMQDAVFKVGDLSFSRVPGCFRSQPTASSGKRRPAFQRVSSVAARPSASSGSKRSARSALIEVGRRGDEPARHSLSAKGEGPDGVVELLLAGGGTIALEVECIEAQLADTGGAWETTARPEHEAG